MNYLIRLTATFRILVSLLSFGEFFSLFFDRFYFRREMGLNRRIALIGCSMSRVQNTSLQNRAFVARKTNEICSFSGKLLWLDRKLRRKYFALQGDTIIVVVLSIQGRNCACDLKETQATWNLFDTREFSRKQSTIIEKIAIVPSFS